MDIITRRVLRAYMDSWVVKYHWYDVAFNGTFQKNDKVQINDVAELFNFFSNNLDDFWYVDNRSQTDNKIMVFGGNKYVYGVFSVIPDTELTISVGTYEIVFDYTDTTFKAILPAALSTLVGEHIATVICTSWVITSIVDKRGSQSWIFFDNNQFDIVWGNVSIANGAITAAMLSGTLDTDDIPEGITNLYFTTSRVLAIPAIDTAINNSHTHNNLPLLQTYDQTNVDIEDAVIKKHTHSNLSLLETYDFLNSDVETAINNSHTHPNFPSLNAIPNIFSAPVGYLMTRSPSGLSMLPPVWSLTPPTLTPISFPFTEYFTGNGLIDTWTLSNIPDNAQLSLMFNDSGQYYFETIDYTIVWDTITFAYPPSAGQIIAFNYFIITAPVIVDYMDELFTGDGTITLWTLSSVPDPYSMRFVFNDAGQHYFEWVDYTLVNDEITFTFTPVAWEIINFKAFAVTSAWGSFDIQNVWTLGGWSVYKNRVGNVFNLRRIQGTWWITVTTVGDDIIIDGMLALPPNFWEANVGNNLGAWLWLYQGKTWVALNFLSLLGSSTIDISTSTSWEELEIEVNEDWLSARLYRHFMF